MVDKRAAVGVDEAALVEATFAGDEESQRCLCSLPDGNQRERSANRQHDSEKADAVWLHCGSLPGGGRLRPTGQLAKNALTGAAQSPE